MCKYCGREKSKRFYVNWDISAVFECRPFNSFLKVELLNVLEIILCWMGPAGDEGCLNEGYL